MAAAGPRHSRSRRRRPSRGPHRQRLHRHSHRLERRRLRRRDGGRARHPLPRGVRNLQHLLGDRVQHRISAAAVELRRDSDAEPHAALAGAAQIRAPADDADRPVRGAALLFQLAGADGSQGASGAPPVPPAQARPLLAGLANARPRHRRRISRSARRAAHHSRAAAVRVDRGIFPRARRATRQIRLDSRRGLVGAGDADHGRLRRHRAGDAARQAARRRRHAARRRHDRASRRYHRHRLQPGIQPPPIRGHLEHGCARAAVRRDG